MPEKNSKVKLGLKNLAILPSNCDYFLVHLKQKVRLRPELSPTFSLTLAPNPAQTQTRPEKPCPTYNSGWACIVLKTVWYCLSASDKGRNNVTFGIPANPKVSENVLLNFIQSQGVSKQNFFQFKSYIKISERRREICPPLGTNRVKLKQQINFYCARELFDKHSRAFLLKLQNALFDFNLLLGGLNFICLTTTPDFYWQPSFWLFNWLNSQHNSPTFKANKKKFLQVFRLVKHTFKFTVKLVTDDVIKNIYDVIILI